MEKRVRRSKEEIVADIERRIQSHQESIATLTAKKEAILNPKPRLTKAQKIKAVIEQAKQSGLSPEEIAEKLGVTLE